MAIKKTTKSPVYKAPQAPQGTPMQKFTDAMKKIVQVPKESVQAKDTKKGN